MNVERLEEKVIDLEDKHKQLEGQHVDFKDSLNEIAMQTKVTSATLIEIKEALKTVAAVATDIQVLAVTVKDIQSDREKVGNVIFSKFKDIDKVIEKKEFKAVTDCDIKRDKLEERVDGKITTLKTQVTRLEEKRDSDQKWLRNLIYGALILGILSIGFGIIKENISFEVSTPTHKVK